MWYLAESTLLTRPCAMSQSFWAHFELDKGRELGWICSQVPECSGRGSFSSADSLTYTIPKAAQPGAVGQVSAEAQDFPRVAQGSLSPGIRASAAID